MGKKETESKKQQKKQEGKRTVIRAMIEAKVPSACYELSAKPASHSISKHESG